MVIFEAIKLFLQKELLQIIKYWLFGNIFKAVLVLAPEDLI